MKSREDYSAGDAVLSFRHVVVPPDLAGQRLDQVLARLFPDHSRSRLQGWVREGRVSVDEVSCLDVRHTLWGGERLGLGEPAAGEAAGQPRAQAIALALVYEDDALIVVDKPAGLVVHPGSGNPDGTLLNALLHHEPALAGVPRAGIVHRLDKETSGLLVVARTLAAQTHLVRQLQARSVSRRYLALAHGEVLTGGRVDAPIGRHPSQRTRMAVVAGAREAVTHYRPVRRFAGCTLLACALETGRTHQIRVHMAHSGHPLVGDPVYGKRRCRDPQLQAFPRQALHACALALEHPSRGVRLEWESALPADFAGLLAGLSPR